MTIAFINFGYNKRTGIETLADNIMRQIDKIDKENEYILIVNEFAQDIYQSSSRISKKIVKKMASTQILRTLWLLFVYPIYSLIKGIDVTIVFSGASNFSISPFTKNIVFIADLGEFYIKDKYDIKRMFYRKYLALPINRVMADHFIAISQSTQKAIVDKLHINNKKIRLIYCGTDDRIQKYSATNARKKIAEKYPFTISDKIIITIGRIDPVGKNLIRLIDAIDILRKTHEDFHLFLIGGKSNYSDPDIVPKEIAKRNLDNYITLTGYVDVNELNDFYNASDLLVFPSVYEGFGLPLIEAMKCELPVACSNIDVFHEIGDDAVLFFNPYDAGDIAEKIALGLTDESLRKQLVSKGEKRYPVFTWENSASELLKLLNSP
jgi:glycosyltransferase involved in cell wall biosynthesis